ncbi:RNA methyltransferase, TrmH family [Marinospirillum alkaliphilum DSM 21637]|uniref:RNA methyltransferase, TrmH family n=2 Tax=Marinospirillum TaxID=64968 RepID=A0A1K1UHR1_9GAMM|nr:RNA methyltransferase, TrmH family [Marinospirillum alkaliphilum DSM 21637]
MGRFYSHQVTAMLSKNQIRQVRALHRKKMRREEGRFLVEGEKVVAELLASNWPVQALYATPEFINSYSALIRQAGITAVACTADELTSISTLISNDAALAVVNCPATASFTSLAENPWILALDGINDPGNLGSLLRIADWYGIRQLVCSPETAELFNPKVIAASKGSFLRVAVSYQPLDAFFASLPQDTQVLGAYLDGACIHNFQSAGQGGVLLMGSEAHGISSALAPFVTHRITIPAFGAAESLNVAVAAAVICDNLCRLQS